MAGTGIIPFCAGSFATEVVHPWSVNLFPASFWMPANHTKGELSNVVLACLKTLKDSLEIGHTQAKSVVVIVALMEKNILIWY